jgi:hypothetical protein
MKRMTWIECLVAVSSFGITSLGAVAGAGAQPAPPAAKPPATVPPKAPAAPPKAPAAAPAKAPAAPPKAPVATPAKAPAAAPPKAPAAPAPAPPPASDCPPGAFCEKQEIEPPASPYEGGQRPARPAAPPDAQKGLTLTLPPPPPGGDPRAPRTFVYYPSAQGGPGEVVIYEGTAGPAAEAALMPPPPPPPPPPARKRKWKRHRPWGMNLRLEGLLLPRASSEVDNAGMGGLGLSLKYRPLPIFAVDVGADFLGGVDANGLDRQELPFSASAFFYPNPYDLVQFYAFGGLNWSFARVFADRAEPNLAGGDEDDYTYFGGHLGVGLEFRVSQLVGIDLDGLVLVRTRIDSDDGGRFPEFFNPRTREGSNSSAAGTLRLGVTFWW